MIFQISLKRIGIFSTALGMLASPLVFAQDQGSERHDPVIEQQQEVTDVQGDTDGNSTIGAGTEGHGGAGIEAGTGTQGGEEPESGTQDEADLGVGTEGHGGADIEGSTGTQSGEDPEPGTQDEEGMPEEENGDS